MWQSEQGSFSLDFLDPEWAGVFCVMVGLGFFRQIGQRFQMTVPATVEILEIKVELLYLNVTGMRPPPRGRAIHLRYSLA
jgi:hypothetical protein